MADIDAAATAQRPEQSEVRVMLVDDSSIVRGLMVRALKDDPLINVVTTASNGEMAISMVKQHAIDVIVLDIEMPTMDGITALPKLLEASPHSKIIMASTLTERNASISLEALALGASDYVPKPSSRENAQAIDAFYRELREKVKALGGVSRSRSHAASSPLDARAKIEMVQPTSIKKSSPLSWKMPAAPVKAIAIASSTGGPKALAVVIAGLKDVYQQVPIFVTQHMPPKFTALLAEHIAKDTGLDVVEAKNDTVVKAGTIYIAAGDYHLIPQSVAGTVKIMLNQDPPVNFCRPAADPMFEALAGIYRNHLLGVVLTGMGSDGKIGSHAIVEQGGMVIVQDEATSVVWGMPRAVAQANLCAEVLPLDDIAVYISKALKG